jgi:hypothetical protein
VTRLPAIEADLPIVTAFQQFVRSAHDQLGRRLAGYGFAREPVPERLERAHNFYWVQGKAWRNEAVRLFYRRPHDNAFRLDFGIYLPVEGREEATAVTPAGNLLDGANLDWLVGRKKPYYLPVFLGRPRVSRAASFARTIGRDVEGSLDWFEGYRRPLDCLKKLERGETVGGTRAGMPTTPCGSSEESSRLRA